MRRLSLVPRPASLAVAGAFLAGSALRFIHLSQVPPSLYCDEAFHGYQAYSLLLTGADSRGVAWPLFFDIFGVGWEEPLYIYLTMLPVSLLGNTEAAVRVVAAAAGSAAILAVAWLAARMAGRLAGAVAALTMAFSPWALQLSRVGFQASLLPLFLAAGAGALLRAVPGGETERGGRESPRTAWLAAGMLVLSVGLYTYVAARGVIPLLLLGFVALHAGPLWRLPTGGKIAAAAALAVPLLPLAVFALSPEGMERFQDVGLATRMGGPAAVARFFSNYAGYYSPSFLLTDGDQNLRHSAAGFGMLHAHDLALLVVGLLAVLVRRRPADLFMAWWLAVAPLGAALTADPGHAVRAIGAVPAVHALAGVGAGALFGPGRVLDLRRLAGQGVAVVLLAGAAVSTGVYLRHYFVEYPVYSAPAWQYGLEEAYRRVEELKNDHDSVYVTRAEDFPYIHRLYLLEFPPSRYQERGFRGTPYLFDEPVFYRGDLIPGRKNPLFLLRPHELEGSGLEAREVIPNPDGSAAFVLAW